MEVCSSLLPPTRRSTCVAKQQSAPQYCPQQGAACVGQNSKVHLNVALNKAQHVYGKTAECSIAALSMAQHLYGKTSKSSSVALSLAKHVYGKMTGCSMEGSFTLWSGLCQQRRAGCDAAGPLALAWCRCMPSEHMMPARM